ncbi:MAG: hypothetical protein VKK04_02320 [Synechococcales bacterium]|nr:hypothetical protein [Synechococcales bacterium]
MKQSHQSIVVTVAIALTCIAGLGALQFPRLQSARNRNSQLSTAELQRQDQLTQARLDLMERTPTFGFGNLTAKWTFLNFLQYFGDEPARLETGYDLSPEYFEVILSQDPYFWDAYLFLSGSTTLYAGQPERAIALMDEHLPQLSPKVPDRAYYIWRWKGVDELLFLGDSQAAQASFETAADWASAYTDSESEAIAAQSRQTAEFLADDPNSRPAQISAWTSVFYTAVSDDVRQLAISRMQALGAQVSLSADGQLQVQLPPDE